MVFDTHPNEIDCWIKIVKKRLLKLLNLGAIDQEVRMIQWAWNFTQVGAIQAFWYSLQGELIQ